MADNILSDFGINILEEEIDDVIFQTNEFLTDATFTGSQGPFWWILQMCMALAALFSIIVAASMAYKMMVKNEPLDVMKLFKPLVVSIILCWWYPPADTGMTNSGSSWCVLDFLSYIPNCIGSYTHDLYEAEATQISDKFEEVQQLVYVRDSMYTDLQAQADVAHKGTSDPNLIEATMEQTGVDEVTNMEKDASKLWFTSLTAGAVVGIDKIVMLIALIVFRIGWWATFAKFVGIDMVMNVGMEHLSKKGSSQEVCVEECISKGVFGTGTNVFASFRKQAKVIKNHENSYIKATNSHFKNKIPTSNITFMDWTKQTEQTSFPWNKGTFLDPQRNEATKRTGKYKDVPLIVAPGQEDEYLEVKARLDAEAEKEKKAEPKETPDSSTEEATPSVVQQEETALQTNENGWDGLLQSFGLNGFSDIGKNLGYVLAMLPDVLVGLFTGKTKSLNMDNSLLPLASIVAGMFVKNPILKMLLMGMGGANLLNKAGHEVLGRKQQEGIAPTVSPAASRIQYRQYPDEPLNPRISNPMLQGRCLVANIDHVPCTIQLPDSVIGAHQSGALPLNTLANAILAKNDQMRQMAAMQYEEQARESVVRPRGIQ